MAAKPALSVDVPVPDIPSAAQAAVAAVQALCTGLLKQLPGDADGLRGRTDTMNSASEALVSLSRIAAKFPMPTKPRPI